MDLTYLSPISSPNAEALLSKLVLRGKLDYGGGGGALSRPRLRSPPIKAFLIKFERMSVGGLTH